MARNSPINRMGYVGAEINRTLTPEEVVWAREEYAEGRVTVRELSQLHRMGAESVRRMLRGDTYANIGRALPRQQEFAQQREIHDGGALQRLLKQQEEIDKKEEPKLDEILPTKSEPFDPLKAMEDVYANKGTDAKAEVPQEVRDADPFGEE